MGFDKENPEDDRLLWDKFLAGDDEVYAYFYKRYVDALFSYGMKFTSDRELVKDCIQDVFVKLYGNRSRLGEVRHIRVYLFISLKNALFSVFKKDKTMYHIDTVEPVFYVDYTAEDIMIAGEAEEEERQLLARIFESLTPRQKEVIYYRYVEGMEIDSICRLMDINYQSALNLISRSIQKVRNTFACQSSDGCREAKRINLIPKQGDRYAK
ncbi:MAG: sigma-70 family RNA polymerase sigma factor [Tannerellaceae bacterium]|jgi:RNA polymerase sigma factor (sigma-70 family)|nr:sigma-70 family RNA polymerase sigma factor [Tannerellaceae bacterium]